MNSSKKKIKGKMRKTQGMSRRVYNTQSFKLGQKRQTQVCKILVNRGYDVEYADPNYNGVDIKAWKIGKNFSGSPDLVVECTNYSKTSYLGYKRALSYILHLKQFPNSKKMIVVSYWDNIKALASLFKQDGIQIKVMGKQEL
jgi:hypothetical protein